MIEVRDFTREEFYELINFAPETETRNLIRIAMGEHKDPYDMLRENSIDAKGMFSDGRLVYIAVLSKAKELWTVVNRGVKDQFSLFKNAKKNIDKWIASHGAIYATMEKVNLKNIAWTERLGFKRYRENERTISFIYQGS
jgi:hypothetical protein